MAVIFCMDCLKDEFERDALDSNRAAPDGALKWCSGTYVATTKAKQQRHPSVVTAHESTLECREGTPTARATFTSARTPRLGLATCNLCLIDGLNKIFDVALSALDGAFHRALN